MPAFRMLAAIVVAVLLTSTAQAEDYPSRAIKLVIGFPPGGNVDSVGRVLAQEMTKGLGQPVIVENKPGVVGSLAAELVSRTAPDGYTLLLVPGAHPVTAALYKSLQYNPIDDFAWISIVTSYPFAISVRSASPLKTLRDLLQAAKAKPGGVSDGSSGSGSIQHMTAELLASQAGVKFLQVPYKGEALALTAALSGEVDFVVTTTTLVAPHLQAGTLRTLAVTSKTRWKDLPNVPTVDESGVPGFEVTSWSGLAAAHGTPEAIVARLNAEIRRTIAVPEVRARLESFGGDVHASTPDEMKVQVAREVARWKKVVEDAHIQQQ